MSAWMYSMMCPMWNGPLAYGRAVVTKNFSAIPGVYRTAGAAAACPGRRRLGLADVLDQLELSFVDGLFVGLLAGDLPLIEQLLDGGVHGAHAELAAGLHGVLELIELALANEVRGGGRVDEDLEGCHAALLVCALQQLLRDDAAQ